MLEQPSDQVADRMPAKIRRQIGNPQRARSAGPARAIWPCRPWDRGVSKAAGAFREVWWAHRKTEHDKRRKMGSSVADLPVQLGRDPGELVPSAQQQTGVSELPTGR